MTNFEFRIEIAKIEKEFNQKYGEMRVSLIWKEFGKFPRAAFRKAVDKILFKSNHLPTVKEFCEHFALERERNREDEKRQEKKGAENYKRERAPKEFHDWCQNFIKNGSSK